MFATDNHKVRSGGGALAALVAAASLEDAGLETEERSATPNSSFASTTLMTSPEVGIGGAGLETVARGTVDYQEEGMVGVASGTGLASAPVPVPSVKRLSGASSSSGRQVSSGNQAQSHSVGSESRLSSLLSLSCFSGGSQRLLGEEDVAHAPECEVGIRPSFYWLDGPVSLQEREEAEASFRFLKADCQDEACVLQDFAGVPGVIFIGVFDGHGPHGRSAAKFASSRLPIALAKYASAVKSRSDRRKLKAMKAACKEVNDAMQDPHISGFDASMSGTTACFALLSGGRCLVANVGDSRCVLGRHSSKGSIEGVSLTVDAKPNLPAEEKRILLCGGTVQQLLDESGERRGAYRVFRRGDDVLPGLAMSRSLGDTYAHSVGVTWEPMFFSHNLSPMKDLFLIFGTDGLWDVMENDAAVDFVDRYRQNRDADGLSCAEALTLEAQERWKRNHEEALVDDVSVAILHVAPLPPPQDSPRNSTLRKLQSLPRAASCNDEANQLSCLWKNGNKDEDPSHHSPRQYFKHLYVEEGLEKIDIQSMEPALHTKPDHDSVLRHSETPLDVVKEDQAKREDLKEMDSLSPFALAPSPRQSASQEEGHRGDVCKEGKEKIKEGAGEQPSWESSTTTRGGLAVTLRRAGTDPGTERGSGVSSASETLHESSLHTKSATLESTSESMPPGGAGVPDRRHPTQSRPIPMAHHPHASASAPSKCLLESPDEDSSNLGDTLRPVRKVRVASSAFPSSSSFPYRAMGTSRLASVPSWDGAFISSFTSDSSLRNLGPNYASNGRGTGMTCTNSEDTPRSQDNSDNDSACALGHDLVLAGPWASPSRPRRCEGRHEGKVHRGIPRSLSLSSTAIGSRISSDSDRPSHGSRVGSFEDVLHLGSSMTTTGENALGSPHVGIPLSRTVSDVHSHTGRKTERDFGGSRGVGKEQAESLPLSWHRANANHFGSRGSMCSRDACSVPRVVRNVHLNLPNSDSIRHLSHELES